MMWGGHWMGGGHWLGGGTMGVLWILVLVVVAALLWRAFARSRTEPPQGMPRESQTPEEILRRRFARGEIDERELERRREALRH